MDTTTLSAIVGIISTIILLGTVIVMLIQVNEMRRATYATAFKAVYDLLQTDDVRSARRVVFTKLANKPFEAWTQDEKQIAEKVCSSYDCAAIMVRNGMVPAKVVADSWGDSLRKTWGILAPLVTFYRLQRNSGEYWDDYEWLAGQAQVFRKTTSEKPQ
jgi:hypothetical protein